MLKEGCEISFCVLVLALLEDKMRVSLDGFDMITGEWRVV